MSELFRRFARAISQVAGSSWAFLLALLVVIVWAATGPMYGYSNTWQLVINTGTTIITFLMVFLIQNMQNRDSLAMHLKLDELLRAVKNARTGMVDLEDLSDADLRKLQREFERLHRTEAERTANAASRGNRNRDRDRHKRRRNEIGEIGEHDDQPRGSRTERVARARAGDDEATAEERRRLEERRLRAERRRERIERGTRNSRPPNDAAPADETEGDAEASASVAEHPGAASAPLTPDQAERRRRRRRRRGGGRRRQESSGNGETSGGDAPGAESGGAEPSGGGESPPAGES